MLYVDLSSPIGLLKMHATRTAQETAADAVQVCVQECVDHSVSEAL